MGFLFGLFAFGLVLGAGVGLLLPLPGRSVGFGPGKMSTGGIIATVVAVPIGVALAIFGPALFLSAVGLGTGSYEDVLFIWPVTMASFPLGLGLLCARWFRKPVVG